MGQTNNLNIKVGLDGTEFNSNMQAVLKEFEALKGTVTQNKLTWQESNLELKKFEQEFKSTSAQTQEMKDNLAQLKNTVDTNKIAYNEAKLSLDKYKAGMGDVNKRSGDFRNAIGGLNSALATLGIGVSFAAIISGIKEAGTVYEEQQKQVRVLQSQLKATGSASGETADDLTALAERYQDLTGVQNDTIMGAENIVLSFRNIGSDIFPQVIQAALNMSTVLGQDLNSTCIQLGKALQDPINGLTSLRRVGVAFTQSQKDMIVQMVKAGEGAEAQKLILKELEKEFGGAAQSAETMGDKYNTAIHEMQETTGHFVESGAGKRFLNWITEGTRRLTYLINNMRLFSSSASELSIDDAREKLIALNNKENNFTNKFWFPKAKANARDAWDNQFSGQRNELVKRILDLKKLQKEEQNNAKNASHGGIGEDNFNLGKSKKAKKKKGKKGKSQDEILSQKADELKAESDLEIASNDYTDAEILKKKIELQNQLIKLYHSTTTKGKTEQIEAQADLLNLEKQYNEQTVNDKIDALNRENEENKIYSQMDVIDELNNMRLTEKQRQDIKNNSDLEELRSEIRLQQQILDLRRDGVDDISKLSQKEQDEYNKQLIKKLDAEKDYQEKLGEIRNQQLEKNKKMADSISDTLTDGIKSAIDGTKTMSESFSDMLETMAADLMNSAFKKEVDNLLNEISSQTKLTQSGVSAGGGFFSTALSAIGNLFDSGYAEGGDPTVNKVSLVGEKGPELFIPHSPGTIITNEMLKRAATSKSSANAKTNINSQQQTQANDASTIIYAPQIQTKAKKEDVMSALKESGRDFFAYLGNGAKNNTGGFRTILKGL